MDKKRVMISQLMQGKTEKEILEVRNKAEKKLEELGYEVVNTYTRNPMFDFFVPDKNKPIYYLAVAICGMSSCDAVYFCKDWEKARGCKIEHEIAKQYGLELIHEEETELSQKSLYEYGYIMGEHKMAQLIHKNIDSNNK